MEESTYNAIMIGVYCFVFIIALTAGVMLMRSILDMVEIMNEPHIIGMNGTLAESIGEDYERVYTGLEIRQYGSKSDDNVYLDSTSADTWKNLNRNKKYELEYNNGNFIFKKIE